MKTELLEHHKKVLFKTKMFVFFLPVFCLMLWAICVTAYFPRA